MPYIIASENCMDGRVYAQYYSSQQTIHDNFEQLDNVVSV